MKICPRCGYNVAEGMFCMCGEDVFGILTALQDVVTKERNACTDTYAIYCGALNRFNAAVTARDTAEKTQTLLEVSYRMNSKELSWKS